MDTLERVDLQANNLKYGLRMILKALFVSKNTLQELNISENKSINKAINPLKTLITACPKLDTLNISDLNLKKAYCGDLSSCLLSKTSLKSLTWNYDLEIDGTVAFDFISKIKCPGIKMTGVFQNRDSRK